MSSHVLMTMCDVCMCVVIGHMHASLHHTRWGLYTVLSVGSIVGLSGWVSCHGYMS